MIFIMSQQFVDREEELAFLDEAWKRGPQLIVIYGRRRIGKTELLLRFARDRPHLYFLADKTSIPNNLRRLARRMADYLKRPSFARISFQDWESLFREFVEWKGEERMVMIIDEFPYLIELSRSVPSEFQVIWDEILSKRDDIVLVLCGSSIGIMESEVLGYRSPLYGRRTGQWKVREIHPLRVRKFVPGYTLEDSFRVYGVLGGVPAYLSQLDGSKGFWENVRDLLLRKGSPLYEEVDNLLRMELREPKNYKLVLQALAEGKRRVTEIANLTGLDKALVSRYLEVLRTMDLVAYETPLLESPSTKRRRYYISDKYFRFWFRYVQPNREMIEEGRSDELITLIRRDFDAYMGPVFEEIVRKSVHRILPFTPLKVGRHWWKERGEAREIDLLAVGEGSVALVEVKWSDLRERDVERIVDRLRVLYRELGLERYGKGIFVVVARRAPKMELEDAHVMDLSRMEAP